MDWLQWVTASGAVGAVGLAIATYLKTRPQMKHAETESEQPLWGRIAALEEKVESERANCDQRIERIEKRHDADVADLKDEVGYLRHDRNNLRQGVTALFAMLKQHDDPSLHKIAETAEALIDKGDLALATERAAVTSSRRRKT